jgi:hypothetical protein
VFCGNDTLPETKVLIIALYDSFHFGVISSRFHVLFAEVAGARLGVGNDPTYNHTECFDPFPFPDGVSDALKDAIRREGELLDDVRKKVLQDNPNLSLTALYGILQRLREGQPLTDEEKDLHERGLVSVIRAHHDALDRLVAQAYGWSPDISNEDVIARLVELNKKRAAEEESGLVRWLRPEFQAPREPDSVSEKLDLGERPEAAMPVARVPWPTTLPDQVSAVARILTGAPRPLSAADVARAFDGKRASTVMPVLDALAAIGQARRLADGRYAS